MFLCICASLQYIFYILDISAHLYSGHVFGVGGSVYNSLGNTAFRGFLMQNPLGLWTFAFNKVNKPKGNCVLILQIASTPT